MIGAIFVHVRGLPMFATLLGYGVGMILVRDSGAWNRLTKTPGKPAYFLCREICRSVVRFVCGSD